MERSDALLIFDGAFKVARKQLERCKRLAPQSRLKNAHLEAARAELDDAVRTFGMGDACVVHDDLYLPMFDSLGHINEALHSWWQRDQNIDRALAALDAAPVASGR